MRSASDGPASLLVVSKGARRLDVLDLDTLDVLHQVPLSGDTGHEVGARDGTPIAYVPIYGAGVVGAPSGEGDRIDVIDLGSGTAGTPIRLPARSFPHHLALRPDGSLVVTCEGRRSLVVIDPGTGQIAESDLEIGQGHMLALSHDGRRAWTAHASPGFVVETDLEPMRATRSLWLSPRVSRIATTHDMACALVADHTSRRLAVVDLENLSLVRWIDLPGVAFGIATTSTGTAVVAMRERSSLALVDLASMKVEEEVPVPGSPQSVVIDEHASIAIASCTPADVVVAVHLRTAEVLRTQRVGEGADGLALWRP